MLTFSADAGNAMGASAGNDLGSETVRWPAPGWKFGTSPISDRHDT